MFPLQHHLPPALIPSAVAMRLIRKTIAPYICCLCCCYGGMTMQPVRAFLCHHYGTRRMAARRRSHQQRHQQRQIRWSDPRTFRHDDTKTRCSSSSTSLTTNNIPQHDDTTNNDDSPSSPTDNTFRIFYNDVYEVPLPPNHRFPMEKYRLVRERVQQAILSATKPNDDNVDFVVSPLATVDELLTTHNADYIKRFLQGQQTEAEQRNVGFPWSPEGVNRSLSSVGGTLAAARHVCNIEKVRKAAAAAITTNTPPPPAWAAHVAGGTHHAFFDYGEGFSVFSDMAVAANVILQEYNDMNNILLVDLDVHQGNGNAVLFQGNDQVFTFSMHCNGNYFSEKQHSDLDIELPIGCNDSTYLMTLNHWLSKEFLPRHKNREFPIDLVIYQAGVDILEADRLGRMSLTPEGVQRRNQLVYQFVDALQVPLVICMGGGYPKRNEKNGWNEILDAHASVYLQAYEFLKNR